MPIVLNNGNSTDKNKDGTPPGHDPDPARSGRSRRTLSAGSLHRLKKEVGASLQQHQPRQCQAEDDHWEQEKHAVWDEKWDPSTSPSYPIGPEMDSIGHCLSAFTGLDQAQADSNKECVEVMDSAEDSCKPCSKEVEEDSVVDSTESNTTARSKGASLPKLDCMTKAPSETLESHVAFSPMPYPESVPSPAASEDAEDVKSPRRSRRARRPPRPKEVEEYITHIRQPSLMTAPLSTPPSSPLPQGQERDVVATPSRKRSGSVRPEKVPSASASASGMVAVAVPSTTPTVATPSGVAPTSSNEPPSPASSSAVTPPTSTSISRKATQDLDFASIPGVVTTQRIRRPPQNLAEFVSSEDFKAAPCGRRQAPPAESVSRDKREAKRSKSEGQLSCSGGNGGKKCTAVDSDDAAEVKQQSTSGSDRSASPPSISSALEPKAGTRPTTIPLSALSHAKRSNQSLSCLSSKRQRRDGSSRSRQAYNKRHTREEILERRRRDGKREIMVASEDDWSDSDFDFLRDEQENYRLMCIRARKTQVEQSRWNVRDKFDDGYGDFSENEDFDNAEDDQCRVEGEKIKLLMDPSVINYGFDSGDGEYILDYHQGPLFNNVTWPEFSDAKEVNRNNGNTAVANTTQTNGGLPTPAADHLDDMDMKLMGDIIPGFTRVVGLDSQASDLIPSAPRAGSSISPLEVSSVCDSGSARKQDADEWSLFVGSCGPKMEGNSGANRRAEADTVGKSLPSLEQPIPEAEIAAAADADAAAVGAGDTVTEAPVHMEEIEIHTTTSDGSREDIEVEDFIGWSLCE
ncbi:hypothetical protein BGX31_008543 [Mortierella sp. GBA43]|nr:hypothetical protein BGX31_008543 [Mortierella sp. GBA43]